MAVQLDEFVQQAADQLRCKVRALAGAAAGAGYVAAAGSDQGLQRAGQQRQLLNLAAQTEQGWPGSHKG